MNNAETKFCRQPLKRSAAKKTNMGWVAKIPPVLNILYRIMERGHDRQISSMIKESPYFNDLARYIPQMLKNLCGYHKVIRAARQLRKEMWVINVTIKTFPF